MQIFVTGISTQNYPVAIIVPDKECAFKWAKQSGFYEYNQLNPESEEDFKKLCDSRELNDTILQDIKERTLKAKVNHFDIKIMHIFQLSKLEFIQRIFLTNVEFSVQNDTITPTMKIKRNKAEKLFADKIKELYQN